MASSKEYLHFILEQLSALEGISYREMMGEFILYCNGVLMLCLMNCLLKNLKKEIDKL